MSASEVSGARLWGERVEAVGRVAEISAWAWNQDSNYYCIKLMMNKLIKN